MPQGEAPDGEQDIRGVHLRFPDVPKLALDELIDQLVDRAQGVRQAQGRLRSLLRAISSVTENLSTETVLHNVLEAARELSGARYAALGVLGRDGGLERLLHDGMDDATVHTIGMLPLGKGLIGALNDDPRPIRLGEITSDRRSEGFPPGHPQMHSFLGVPIRVRGELFGALYLGDDDEARFTAEDEELVVALATAAGTAISNARLYADSRLQQRWLSASAEIGRQLLADDGEGSLRTVARRSAEIADADLVSVALLTREGDGLSIEVSVGEHAGQVLGRVIPVAQTVAGLAVERAEPLLLDALEEPERRGYVSDQIDVGPLMLLPLAGAEGVRGVLSVARSRGRAPFHPSDLTMAAGFADYASVALELADSRASEHRVALLEDRERIARDLHDHVIQELFAVGLGLQSLIAGLPPDDPMGDRLQQRVEDLDRTIRRIRTSIFLLRGSLSMADDGVRREVTSIVDDLTPALGFAPAVSLDGLVDLGGSPDLADDVVATVRETLTNVAKHAHAHRASVEITAGDGVVTVTVTDDGVGIAGAVRSSGVANLRARAEALGGSFSLSAGSAGGTVAVWSVPVDTR